ncbi:uncharacterized protein AC631_00931 [Debaryomyces fabryi]|uniref:Exocyst complex component EXO84 n=1 Tax=Debaryomyces fabryi TaxID=58627 RepID=A0A0V1Q462_9ASCO|nr:uncharacterized protein AC631_00931 [Debaryomyces fabryi]KSA03293.1 hypothetical protein AC631_00931 [Debaryomyces fabryi]CUM45116.1 unnamed protein product [Debaryomyces fabryi]
MNFDVKASNRKSRAPWQSSANNTKISNPYADANTSVVTNNENNDSLQVPNPYGVNNKSNRKNTRRLSIHASAAAAGHGRGPFDSTNLPPVPQLYKTNTQSSDAVLAISKGQEEEEVDIETKIFGELSNGTATEIDDYYKVLVKQKALITRDMKSNINQNQKNILELTNDLKETQEELLQLRITTKELYGVLDEFKEAAERRIELEHETQQTDQNHNNLYAALNSKKRKDRSSVMVLGKMWASELQSLCKHVDGASKYVQPLPGRHVLAESGRWYEVNVGTWKPTKATHLFMLNDLVLIATKKNSMSQDTGDKKTSRLQAIHCWPLHEVKLSEVRVPSNSTKTDKDGNKLYVINIKSKSLSYVYQTDRYDHFLKITEAYNKGRNEILAKERMLNSKSIGQTPDLIETDDEKRQLRQSLRNSGISDGASDETSKRKSGTQRNSADILLQDISARVHSRNRSHDFDHGPHAKINAADRGQFFNDLKKIEDRLDEVDIEISRNKYTESVGLIKYIENKLSSIELAISNNSSNALISVDEIKLLIDVIKLKINNRKSKIQQCLGFDLQHNIGKLTTSQISIIIEFFHNFDQLDKGISLYLQAVTNNLSITVSRLVVGVQGSTKIDVVNYLSNLVIINVSIIKRAITVYKECIVPVLKKDLNGNVDSSGLINWSIDEVAKLVKTIKKHLYGSLVVLTGNNEETEEPTYKVKDTALFQEFIGVVKPQLNTLKNVGVNVEFLFDDILSLK